jgi:putative transposase
MRYPASEKLEIIRLDEGSDLSVKRALDKLGVSGPTFYRWYDLYRRFGEVGLEDRRSHPGRVWNRIPDHVRKAMLEMALARPELSPRELAVTFTDERRYTNGFRVTAYSMLAFTQIATFAPIQLVD